MALMAIVAPMREMAARDARNRFGHLLDASQRTPVLLTRKGRAVSMVMSVEQYECLRGTAWERLTATMGALGQEASMNALKPSALRDLLADES